MTLKKWIISGPEKTRVLREFESFFKLGINLELDYRKHNESMSMELAFQEKVLQKQYLNMESPSLKLLKN